MIKTITVWFLLLFSFTSIAQDVFYTTRNPEGILVKKWRISFSKTYTFYPIDNSNQPIKCPSRQLKSITFADGSTEDNKKHKEYEDVALKTNNRTGNIESIDSVLIQEKTSIETLNYIQNFKTSNENIEFKKIEGQSDAQYIGKYTLYYDRGFFNIYFILRFNISGEYLIHQQSNFVMIREKINPNWVTETEILNHKNYFFKVEDFYYSYSQVYKPVFWKPLSINMQFIDDEIKRFIYPPDSPPDNTIKYYENIALNDSIITINGKVFPCKFDSINDSFLYFYKESRNKIVHTKTPIKNVYRLYKSGEKPIIYSHKHTKKKGDYIIMDKSTVFMDILIGSTSMFGVERKYDYYNGSYYTGLSKGPSVTLAGKFGFKKYFVVQTLRYTPGLQFFLQPKLHFGDLTGGEVSLFLGYTSLLQTKKKYEAIEFNANIGFGSMIYDEKSSGFLLFHSFNTKAVVVLNPTIKYRYKRLALGISYSWSNGIDTNPDSRYTKLQAHSIFFTLGRTF